MYTRTRRSLFIIANSPDLPWPAVEPLRFFQCANSFPRFTQGTDNNMLESDCGAVNATINSVLKFCLPLGRQKLSELG